MKSRSLSLILILELLSCGDKDVEFKENDLLKSRLEGRWSWGGFQSFGGVSHELEFQDDKVSWYDSSASLFDSFGNGEAQSIRGNCTVKYSFNDGVQYYKTANTSSSFDATTEDNILWAFINEEHSTIRNYTITDNIVKFENEWTAPATGIEITSSFVIFSTDFQVADFYAPLPITPPNPAKFYHFGQYHKTN